MERCVKEKGRQARGPSPLGIQRTLGLAACSPASPTPRGWCSRSNVARSDCRSRLRRCCTARNDPELDAVFFAETAVDDDDARLIEYAFTR